jgi:twinkle protein
MLTDDHAQWLEARGLDVEVATRIGIESQGKAIAFPYKRGGQLISCKLRHLDKSMSFDRSGAPLVLFNLECIENLSSNPDEPLIFVEGEFDAVAVLQSGFQFVVSVPTGASGKRTEEPTPADKDTGYSYLWQDGQRLPELKRFHKIVLAVDGDVKGQILRDELALRLGRSRCFWVKYPAGCKDPNDLLKARGVHGVRELVEQATPLAPAATVSLMDLPPRPNRVAFSTGWKPLDRTLMLFKSGLLVVTGIPNHGKSQWGRSLAFHLAESHGWKTCFYASEDEAQDTQSEALRFIGRPGNLLTPGIDRTSDPTIHAKRRDWVRHHFRIFIDDFEDGEQRTLDRIIEEMEIHCYHYGTNVFEIDPWTEIEHRRPKHQTETEYIKEALYRLKLAAKRLEMLLLIVAHPTKVDQEPTLYDINGSAQWFNQMDWGVVIHRENTAKNRITVRSAKIRKQPTCGVPGFIHMSFNCAYADFFAATSVEAGNVEVKGNQEDLEQAS